MNDTLNILEHLLKDTNTEIRCDLTKLVWDVSDWSLMAAPSRSSPFRRVAGYDDFDEALRAFRRKVERVKGFNPNRDYAAA